MSEYADIIIPLLGMVTALFGSVTAFLVWMQRRTAIKLREKDAQMETIENKQIKAESDATNTKAQLDILRETVAGAFENQKMWQGVMNTISERRRESDTEISRALKDNTQAVSTLSGVLEIQAAAYSNFKTVVEDSLRTFIQAASATHTAIDSQKSELTLIQQAIQTLTTRIADMIDLQEKHVLSQDERHGSLKLDNQGQKSELIAINDALKTMSVILQKILGRMESTQPIPFIEESEPQAENKEAVIVAEEQKP